MTSRTERLTWVGALVLTLIAATAWRAATPAPLPARDELASLPHEGDAAQPESLGEQVLHVIANDPFRLDRVPPSMPYGTSTPLAANPMQTSSGWLDLKLTGLVGPPWRAVLEGFPGREGGVVLSVGDTLAGVRVQAIRPERVVLRAPDTTWTLTVRRAW